MRWAVRPNAITNWPGRTPNQNADRIAAIRMPVPVADSQLNRNSAFSGSPRFGTTGSSRNTSLCRYGAGIVTAVMPANRFGRSHHFNSTVPSGLLARRASIACFDRPPSRNVRACGTPQTKTQTLNSTHGIQAETISRVE
jgi:hypothetical protein